MTQRKWTTTDGWQVLTGWDRPLQHFFVNIDRECTGCDGDGDVTDGIGGTEEDPRDCETCEGSGTEYLFNNLSDTQYTDPMGGMSIEQVAQVLNLKLTAVPHTLTFDLMADKAKNVGNFIQDYGTLGEEREETDAQ
jgi:hypothetical protein